MLCDRLSIEQVRGIASSPASPGHRPGRALLGRSSPVPASRGPFPDPSKPWLQSRRVQSPDGSGRGSLGLPAGSSPARSGHPPPLAHSVPAAQTPAAAWPRPRNGQEGLEDPSPPS